MFLNILEVPIKGGKTYRIIKGLQGWFQRGTIRFADTITCKNDLILEILRFPKSQHDDILDTLADQFANQSGEMSSDIYPDAPKWTDFVGIYRPPNGIGLNTSFLGFDPITHEHRWIGEQMTGDGGENFSAMTGAI